MSSASLLLVSGSMSLSGEEEEEEMTVVGGGWSKAALIPRHTLRGNAGSSEDKEQDIKNIYHLLFTYLGLTLFFSDAITQIFMSEATV